MTLASRGIYEPCISPHQIYDKIWCLCVNIVKSCFRRLGTSIILSMTVCQMICRLSQGNNMTNGFYEDNIFSTTANLTYGPRFKVQMFD